MFFLIHFWRAWNGSVAVYCVGTVTYIYEKVMVVYKYMRECGYTRLLAGAVREKKGGWKLSG